jgi:sulfite dehydrogenase (cytochrome) subunit B
VFQWHEENDHATPASPRARCRCRPWPRRRTAAPVSYTLPEETTAFKPGVNLEVVQNNCTACHSADYIKTQPRGEKFKKDFWTAEVTKMIKVYGAPIEDADVGKIVDYLTANY